VSYRDLLAVGDDLLDPGAVSGSGTPEQPGSPVARSTWRVAVGELLRNRLGVAGLTIIVLMALFSFVGPLVYHSNQVTTNLTQVNLRPGGRFPLGTDQVGYDVLGRLMVAGQSSLEVGLAAAAIAAGIGTIWGAVAAFAGGWADSVMMRVVDALIAIPTVLLVLLLATIVTPSVLTIICVLGFVSWIITARLVRGEVLVLRTLDYVSASKLAGERPVKIVLRHIVRNVIGIVAVQATFEVANAILLLAALSFLGLGPPPPAVNWGGMLTTGLNFIYDGYWWQIYPAGVCIVLTVVAFNLLGDATRDALDVRLRRD
jgi:peptide/nickel transport system permease protein